jgi:hypothetical protein
VLVVVVDKLDEVVETIVVVSSRHPHQPGVWHVAVRVLEDVVLVIVELVVGLVCVPFSNFHKIQSTHPRSSSWHVAASSYFIYTFSIAYLKL